MSPETIYIKLEICTNHTFLTNRKALFPPCIPDEPFTNLKPQEQVIGECYSVQERRVTNFEAPK